MITLGVDCGTQSTKTVALDAGTGEIVASAAHSYPLIDGLPPGHVEQDPTLWVEALDATVAAVLEKLGPRRGAVAAIGVSGQQHGLVALDARHRVIRPAKLWSDTSTQEECRLILEAFGGVSGLLAKTGMNMLPGYTAPKILWLKRHEPQHFARLAHALLPHDYLNFHLTGVVGTEPGDASGTALFDVRQRRWCSDLCAWIDPGLEEKLPPLGPSCQPLGALHPERAQAWGLSRNVLVSAGGGDNMMAAIGTGNTRSGRMTASLGTSGTLAAWSGEAVVDPAGEIAAFCDSSGAWLPLLCTMNVTVATEQLRHLFDWSHDAMDAAIARTPAGADGLLFLPYLQGERIPNLPDARGSLHGMSPRNGTAGHLARATMEGVTLGMAYGLKRLKQLGMTAGEIRLVGGGSRSPLWRQLCADVFGTPVATMKNPEGAALGAAIQALAAVRTEKTIDQWSEELAHVSPTGRAEPDAGRSDLYQEQLHRMETLTRQLYGGK